MGLEKQGSKPAGLIGKLIGMLLFIKDNQVHL